MSVVTEALKQVDWSGKQVCVACSGGVDSIVLLHALVQIGLKPAVLHVNYQLRGEASDRDEQHVVKTAEQLGLPYEVHRCPVELTKAAGINLQAAARDFRRKLFREWTHRSERHVVVLAHHLDDQLETFFLQYFRGSGLFGLGGMHPEKGQIVRPFLAVPKNELIAFARENVLSWREDASNESGAYLRNVLRNQLLPALKKAHPELAESAAVIMSALRDLQVSVAESVSAAVHAWETEQRVETAAWRLFSPEQKLAFVHGLGWPFWSVERLNELAAKPDGRRIVISNNVLISERGAIRKLPAEPVIENWDFNSEEVGILPENWSKSAVYLDPEKLDSPLKLRLWQKGDRIKSIGLQGSQLVSDVLKDAGIPLSERPFVRVLATDREVLWIPGLKVSRVALATQESATIWKITI